MAYTNTITDVLNQWADWGVFAYILPFLVIFAIIYGILSNAKILGENKGVHATIALAVGLLSLQFDYVSDFFATIFPYAGMGLAVLLVALILMGLLTDDEKATRWIFFTIGTIIFLVVLLYTIYDFNWLGGYVGVNWVPIIVLILVVAGAVVAVMLSGKKRSGSKGGSS